MSEPWRVKHDGSCSRCGVALPKGTPAVYERHSHSIRCIECPETVTESRSVRADPVAPIDSGVAGRSARAEHDRREAKRDVAITERWGTGFVAKVVRAVSVEPQSTRAWAIGAAGEEKLARELDGVPGLHMLHDRRVPGTRGNIDHIVVAPAGVFIIDAKNHQGSIGIHDRGGFFRTDYRLVVGGRDVSAMADKMVWQVEAVRTALERLDRAAPIIPVLCFLNVEWPLFRAPEEFRGVRIESHRSVKRLMTTRDVLGEAAADAIATLIADRMPAK